MAILYRAIWSDDGPGDLSDIAAAFGRWVDDKTGSTLTVPPVGSVHGDDVPGYEHVEVRVERAAGPDLTHGIEDVVRATLVESRPDGARWTTTVRAWSGAACMDAQDPSAYRRVWVEIAAETHDLFEDVTIRAPRVVRDLLLTGRAPRRRGLPLSLRVEQFSGQRGAEILADRITDIERDVPVVVFTPVVPEPVIDGAAVELEEVMQRAATSVAGMAAIYYADLPAVTELQHILGHRYAVPPGAFRIYLPDADPARDDDWRHRFYPAPRYLRTTDTAARIVVRAVSLVGISRRVDDSYERARAVLRHRMLDEHNGRLDGLLAEADAERETLTAELQAALDLAGREEAAKNAANDEVQLLGEQVADLRDQLVRARTALRTLGHAGIDAPAECWCARDAHQLAVKHLGDHLVVPDVACRDLADIDGSQQAAAWGQQSWNAFRALHAYAASLTQARTDFWTWCEKSGDPRVWPATSKKLAMTESETVRTSAKLRRQRWLPVDTAVHPDGRIHMWAHLKIAEGGGNLAPRIYFHVEDDAPRVHVGYFGPHRHMHNKHT